MSRILEPLCSYSMADWFSINPILLSVIDHFHSKKITWKFSRFHITDSLSHLVSQECSGLIWLCLKAFESTRFISYHQHYFTFTFIWYALFLLSLSSRPTLSTKLGHIATIPFSMLTVSLAHLYKILLLSA